MILAQALTSAKPESPSTQRTKLINIGTTRDFNLVPDDTVNYYIELADSQIDGILNQMYFTPFNKCHHGTWDVDDDINLGQTAGSGTGGTDSAGDTVASTSKTVVVTTACNLIAGDVVVIHNNITGDEEIHIVATIVDQNTFTTEDNIVGTYLASDPVRIIRIRFPPPLNQISARFAASFIYDKFFAAQADPNTSDYGKEMRRIANGQINDILNGKTLMECGNRRGDMHGNPWLDSAYAHRQPPGGYFTSDRDMSNPK